MFQKLFSTACLTLWFIYVNATNFTGEIRGSVVDSETGRNLEFVSVALYNVEDSVLVTGTLSNEEGIFVIQKVPYGNYYMVCTSLGYDKLIISDISIDRLHQVKNLEVLKMNTDTKYLDEIIVEGEKSAIEYHFDKEVLNVSKVSNGAGGMAANVLENHPAMEIDHEGTVRLRGSTDFIVLVDGKPVSGGSADVLNQIPASSIEKIEVITNPSVKYDAGTTSGVINLITVKSELKGLSGNINAYISNAQRHNGDIFVNYRTEKLSLYTRIGAYHSPLFNSRVSTEERIVDGQPGFQNFTSENMLLWTGKSIDFAIDYYPNKNETVSFFVKRNSSVFGWGPANVIEIGNVADTNYFFLDNLMRNRRHVWHYNLSDIHRFSKNGHELKLDANLIFVDMSMTNDQVLFNDSRYQALSDTAEYYGLDRSQGITRQQYRVDYTLPIGSDLKIESGVQVKLDDRKFSNDMVTQYFLSNTEEWNDDQFESYNYLYAGYVSIQHKLLKNDIRAGLRVEYMDRNMVQTNGDFRNAFNKLDFFPNFNIGRQFSNMHKLRISYGRSIQRPTDLQLNPAVYFRNISGEFSGNPLLQPSYINSLEANYYLPFKESSISVTGFYKLNKNGIMPVRYLTEDFVYRNHPETFDGKQRDLGIELSSDLKVLKWLNLNPNAKLYYSQINGGLADEKFDNQGEVWSLRLITNIKPYKDLIVQLNTYYNSPTVGAQLYQQEMYGVNFSVSQPFFNKKLNISISGTDIFQTESRVFFFKGPGFSQRIEDTFPRHPIFAFNITYKFNNYKAKKLQNVEQGIGFF